MLPTSPVGLGGDTLSQTFLLNTFTLLKWETPTFISLGLWIQHPDLNSVDYKICIEIQQRVCFRNFSQRERNVIMVWLVWLSRYRRVV